MGSIYYINTNPKTWVAYESDKRLKPEFGEYDRLMLIRYGSLDDDPCGAIDLEMYMRQSIYKKLIVNEYRVSPESKNRLTLIIIDRDGVEVPRLSDAIY